MTSIPRQFLICVILFCITVHLSTVECKRYGKKKEKIVVLEEAEPASVVEPPEVTVIEAGSKHVPKTVNLSKAVEVSARPIFVSASKAEEAVDYPASGYPVKIPSPVPAPAPALYSVPGEESKLESVDYASSIPPAYAEEYVYPVVPVKEAVIVKPDLQVANSLHYGGPIGHGFGYGGIGYPVFKLPKYHHMSYKNFGKRFGIFNKWTGRGIGVGYGFGTHHHGYAVPGYKQFNGGFHKTFHFFG